jgi:hypothetical protein
MGGQPSAVSSPLGVGDLGPGVRKMLGIRNWGGPENLLGTREVTFTDQDAAAGQRADGIGGINSVLVFRLQDAWDFMGLEEGAYDLGLGRIPDLSGRHDGIVEEDFFLFDGRFRDQWDIAVRTGQDARHVLTAAHRTEHEGSANDHPRLAGCTCRGTIPCGIESFDRKLVHVSDPGGTCRLSQRDAASSRKGE